MKGTQPATGPIKADPSWKFGIVVSRYHEELTNGLVEGAKRALAAAGVAADHIVIRTAPGSFEIPLLGAQLARDEVVDAVIGLGIVLNGETTHADLIMREVARGMMDVQIQLCVPFAFGVLQVSDLAVAQARCGEKDNRGEEVALAALHSLAELKKVGS